MALPSFRDIQMWAWRRDNRISRTKTIFTRKPSTVGEAAKRFKCSMQEIVDIVGRDHPYFYITGADGNLIFEHDGE